MQPQVKIGNKVVGFGNSTYIIGEIGINHNGDLDIAKKLIDSALHAGCDAVKFQKRTPELCVPAHQRDVMRETPWGYITYMEYRNRVEFDEQDFREIDSYCRNRGIHWFASCWDEPSIDFIEKFNPPCYKIHSAALTDLILLQKLRATGKPLILSTGMSTMDQIRTAVRLLGFENLVILHATSTYPAPPEQLNLRMLYTLMDEFPCPVGYSGHETGLVPTVAAVALGATIVERHITLDRSMWGSDQSASVEPEGLKRLVKYIRTVEASLGDGVKRVYDSEIPMIKKLRRFHEEKDKSDRITAIGDIRYQ